MSMALKYGLMKRAKKMGACDEHGTQGCEMCHGGMMAEGGFVEEEEASGFQPAPAPEADSGEEGIVDRIMKRFSKGGMVANDTMPVADAEPAEYDDLVKDDDLEFSETGANSGDEIGDEQEDEDRKDVVGRIMKSRSKKDRMPRPA